MYKIITIGGNDYKLEYTIEASLYKDCTESLTTMIFGAAFTGNDIKGLISSLTDIPSVALNAFYAGLLEYHGEDGDGKVSNIKEAKKLVKTYFSEGTEDDKRDFYSLLNLCIEQMVADNFFDQLGLNKLTVEEQNQLKVPTDHKKKSNRSVK